MAVVDAVQLDKEGQTLPDDVVASAPEDLQEMLRSLKPSDPLPDEVFEFAQHAYWGPYLKYRWREDSTGPLYTIALGKIATRTDATEELDEPEGL
jgi:hypothetical protein